MLILSLLHSVFSKYEKFHLINKDSSRAVKLDVAGKPLLIANVMFSQEDMAQFIIDAAGRIMPNTGHGNALTVEKSSKILTLKRKTTDASMKFNFHPLHNGEFNLMNGGLCLSFEESGLVASNCNGADKQIFRKQMAAPEIFKIYTMDGTQALKFFESRNTPVEVAKAEDATEMVYKNEGFYSVNMKFVMDVDTHNKQMVMWLPIAGNPEQRIRKSDLENGAFKMLFNQECLSVHGNRVRIEECSDKQSQVFTTVRNEKPFSSGKDSDKFLLLNHAQLRAVHANHQKSGEVKMGNFEDSTRLYFDVIHQRMGLDGPEGYVFQYNNTLQVLQVELYKLQEKAQRFRLVQANGEEGMMNIIQEAGFGDEKCLTMDLKTNHFFLKECTSENEQKFFVKESPTPINPNLDFTASPFTTGKGRSPKPDTTMFEEEPETTDRMARENLNRNNEFHVPGEKPIPEPIQFDMAIKEGEKPAPKNPFFDDNKKREFDLDKDYQRKEREHIHKDGNDELLVDGHTRIQCEGKDCKNAEFH